MTGIKSIAALLIAAIINPLCCCLELTADQPEPMAAGDHSCCTTMGQEDEEQSDLDRHSSDICPHTEERDAQISEAPDTHTPVVKAQLVLYTLFSAFEQTEMEPPLSKVARFTERSASAPPSAAFTETYCVYML
ncbi:hypothetical protein [Pelagicoccus sp. SDUM812003]|uniref:hypothetical protein n=1 Tax=Pelagicoccus sp. SDUM812003 TaxID=3041267 RepID=UPI00280F5C31|nr:hypothetical protein [Pelagicoccus sp. SDUM812003]MDQ8202053.1 hypothetical protein [Pelagicoccus sp. SDUM812003]